MDQKPRSSFACRPRARRLRTGEILLRSVALLTALVASSVSARADGPKPAAPPLDFNRDIRPILSDKCYKCHGPDVTERKAGLRLDTAEGTFKPAKSGGIAVVPGKLDESELYQRIITESADEVMPPPKSGKSLTPAEVARLKTWIEQGAPFRQHWAFVPPVRPALPTVANPGWIKTPVDAFVLSRLEAEGLKPSPEADRTTLIRRVSLDLIGLPPTPEEVDAFVADTRPDAYERLVARLLDSPHYGERWGRLWLDAARYADSDGYEKDKSRQVWFYRDWVINALNRDQPYNDFIIDQIAGDLRPQATQDQIVATGYLRNSMINEEGGVDPEQFRMEAMFDRMDAIGKGILGLTIQCSQCHSHKYDPLTQEEYYRMFAFLNNTHEANVAVYTPDELRQKAELARKIGEIEEDLRHRTPDWPARMAAWEKTVDANPGDWIVIHPTVDDISTGGQKYLPMRDGSFLAQGYAPTKHRVKLTSRTNQKTITGFRLELLNDPNLPLNGPGRSPKGTAALTEFEVEAAPADAPDRPVRIKLVAATADVNPPETPIDRMYDDKSGKRRVTGPVGYAIDGNDETAWGIDVGPGRRNLPRQAVFVPEKPISFPAGTILTIYLKQNHGGWNSDDNQNYNLGRFRLAITSVAAPQADTVPRAVRQILDTLAPDQRTPAQTAAVFSHWRTTVPQWTEANAAIEQLWKSHPEGSAQLVLEARDEPRTTSVLNRGDFLKPVKPVEPGVPAFLNPLPKESASAPLDRLAFARWLVDRQSPTTARAIVNRIWQADFGNGLVTTPEELGSQGDPPSHPELLDWLAVELMDRSWSLKSLHKVIVTSATYRQSSKVTPELLAKDPYNRLLARGPRFRVDAELVRDIALAASGLLDPKVGGPSVYPPAPDFLFQPPASYGPKVWRESKGSDRYRRALYTFRYRSVPYPMLQTFDAPNGDFACVRRPRSNTPLQALVTLNEPEFLECARALALRAIREGGTTEADRLAFAFRRCVARKPTDPEQAVLANLLAREQKRFGPGGLDPWDLVASDVSGRPKLPDGVTAAQLAAWTAVSRVMLNLDETISKE
ncbi:MAG: PSD1 and planctomycete cytochrome C domain-containing protein [Isosphaeraceae bacterium]